MRYFITGDLDIAICETAESAARYTEAHGWREVSGAALSYVWSCRDGRRLFQMATAARRATLTAPLAAREVGHSV